MSRAGDDDERNGAVPSEVCARRPEQHAGEATVATRADVEEVCRVAGEAFRCVVVDDLVAQRDGVVAGQCLGAGQFVSRETACCGVVGRVDEAGADHRRRCPLGVDQGDGVAGPGVVDGPPDRGVRAERSVDPDGDPFGRASSSGGHGVRSRWSRLSVAELAITDRLDSAMAAAAMIGFKNPAAAMGIAAVL